MLLETAAKTANNIVRLIKPYCSTVDIAGSVRREKGTVDDIDIVAEVQQHNKMFMVLFESFGVHAKRDCRKLQFRVDGIKVELYLPQTYDYYRILALRTGSSDYSRKIIAPAWVRKGWRGTNHGLRLEKECTQLGDLWACTTPEPTLPPVWQSEVDFFDWIGINWIEPKYRNA